MPFVCRLVVVVILVLLIVSDRIVVFQSLFHLNDVKRIMMDVMNVVFQGVMPLLAQNGLVYGRVYHHVLRVKLVMY
jgi:hypothetical protein